MHQINPLVLPREAGVNYFHDARLLGTIGDIVRGFGTSHRADTTWCEYVGGTIGAALELRRVEAAKGNQTGRTFGR